MPDTTTFLSLSNSILRDADDVTPGRVLWKHTRPDPVPVRVQLNVQPADIITVFDTMRGRKLEDGGRR